MKEDGTKDMQIEKRILISNTASDHVATTTAGNTISKVIEDNAKNLREQVKEFQEWNT